MLVAALEALCDADEHGLVLLIEELELFLRPQAQRYFYRLLRAFAERGNQVLYSTHEPAFLNELDAERSELFLASAALLVEGRTEKLTFPFVFRALGHDADREGVTIIDCAGKPNMPLFIRICRAAAPVGPSSWPPTSRLSPACAATATSPRAPSSASRASSVNASRPPSVRPSSGSSRWRAAAREQAALAGYDRVAVSSVCGAAPLMLDLKGRDARLPLSLAADTRCMATAAFGGSRRRQADRRRNARVRGTT